MGAFGTLTPLEQPGMLYRVSRIGLAQLDRTIRADISDFSSFNQGQSGPSPFEHTKLMEIGIRFAGEECDGVYFDLRYEGFDQGFTDSEIRVEGSMEISMVTESIETHPNFLDFAGQRGENDRPANLGRNNALYIEEAEGQFRFAYFLAEAPGSTPENPKLNRFAGVSSWQYPSEVYTQERMDTAWPSESELEGLGKILDSGWLEGNVPLLPISKNWLYAGVRVRNIANVYYHAQRVAAASGPRGWIDQIYRMNFTDWEAQD